MTITNPRYLYLNRVVDTGGTNITASGETSGYPDDNLADWREFEKWKDSGANNYQIVIDMGSAVTATAFCMSGHTINTNSARYKLEAHTADAWVGAQTEIVAYTTPSTDYAFADFFSSQSFRYWRVSIDNNGGAAFGIEVGTLFIGNYIEMQRRANLPIDMYRGSTNMKTTFSGDGYPLGNTVKSSMLTMRLSFSRLTQAWITDTWLPFWRSYKALPHFLVWEATEHSGEVYLMNFSDDMVKNFSAPINTSPRHDMVVTSYGRDER